MYKIYMRDLSQWRLSHYPAHTDTPAVDHACMQHINRDGQIIYKRRLYFYGERSRV